MCQFFFASDSAPTLASSNQGLVQPVSPLLTRSFFSWRPTGSPRFPGNPHCVFAMFLDPGATSPSGFSMGWCCPRLSHNEGSLDHTLISRLHRMASTLAVYASWFCFLRTQDSLAIARQALSRGIDYPQGSAIRVQLCFTSILLICDFPGAREMQANECRLM